jgi:hypothetical protein
MQAGNPAKIPCRHARPIPAWRTDEIIRPIAARRAPPKARSAKYRTRRAGAQGALHAAKAWVILWAKQANCPVRGETTMEKAVFHVRGERYLDKTEALCAVKLVDNLADGSRPWEISNLVSSAP